MTKESPSQDFPDDFEPLHGKKRTLSRFLANELLYDYATDNLDAHRRASVEEFLQSSAETKEELEALKQGMQFCDQLAETEISPELTYKLSQVRSWYSRVLRLIHWRNWPEVTKWTLEAMVISGLVAFVAVIGWPKLSDMLPAPRPDLTLAQVDKEKAKVPLPPEDQIASKEKETQKTADLFAANEKNDQETMSVSSEESKTSESTKTAKVQEDLSGQTKEKTIEERPEKSKTSAIVTAAVDENSLAARGDSDATGVKQSAKLKSMKTAPTKPSLKGFVYRVYMDLGNLDLLTEQIRTEIQTLGGKKAGKVRLGWRKPKGSYFHFSMLEANYDTLVDKLKGFGPVRIFKDPHWKVMPEGEIRFILWVEDNDLKQSSGAAASAKSTTPQQPELPSSSTDSKESTDSGSENSEVRDEPDVSASPSQTEFEPESKREVPVEEESPEPTIEEENPEPTIEVEGSPDSTMEGTGTSEEESQPESETTN
ncbi:MAG: hypothetical protein AAF202_03535 [Pseudomonadota bacterium]